MAFEEEDWFNNKYYVHIRRLLTIVGLWPSLKTSRRLPRISFITILMASVINLQIYIILRSERKVESIAKSMQTILPNLTFATSYWNLLYNSALVKKTLRRVRNDWNELTCESELSIMQKYGAQSKVCSQLIGCTFLLYAVVLTLPSIIGFFQFIFGIIDKNKLILPVHDEAFIATTLTYYTMLSLELVAIVTAYTIGITHYFMFISFLQHACALFVIVTNKIDQPFKKNEYKFEWTKNSDQREDEFKWIVTVVKNYEHAIKFVKLITLLYTKIYIVEITAAVFLVIIDFIYFFQLLNFVVTAVEALKICLYINGTLLIIYAYNYLGERLIEHSTSIHSKCQLVPFYTLSVQTNKIFLLLITRSMKPCHISIGGIVVASHELFDKLIKSSFSFATICYKVH